MQIYLQKKLLRQQLQAKRAALSEQFKLQAATTLCDIACSLTIMQNAKHIALYYPYNNEIDVLPLARWAWRNNKQCYLPKLVVAPKSLLFIPYNSNTKLRANTFGILEPASSSAPIAIQNLDLIVLPLVGFDDTGNRLGTGGGYYDLSLAALHTLQQRPSLLGAGFMCQKVTTIPIFASDIALDAIVTEQQAIFFNNSIV